MNKKLSCLHLIFLCLSLIFNAGCNKEKAEAIKIAAEKFRMEAVSVIEKINALFFQSISTPQEDDEIKIKKIVDAIEKEPKINSDMLAFIMSENKTNKNTSSKIDQKLEKIKQDYYQFETMFRSLSEGSFFAKDAVKKAEKHAINLTVQMINFANYLEKYPVQFAGRRISLLEEIMKTKQIKDESLRKEQMTILAGKVLQLRSDESSMKEDAIIQCLKAAEYGKSVSELIRDYDSMSANYLLVSIRNTLSFFTEISNKEELASLLEKYNSVETSIRNDPYWKEILEEKIIQ